MAKYGLRGAYAQYLVAMKRFPEGITSTKLCEICNKDKAAVSRVVGEIEKKGLVIRENIKETVYRAKIKLTETGEAAAAHVLERGERAVAAGGVGLSEEDKKVFYKALSLIYENIDIMTKEGIPK